MKKTWLKIGSTLLIIALYLIMATGSDDTSNNSRPNLETQPSNEKPVEMNNDFSEEKYTTEDEYVHIMTNDPDDETEFNDYYTDFSSPDMSEHSDTIHN